jgi:hypothetical protein
MKTKQLFNVIPSFVLNKVQNKLTLEEFEQFVENWKSQKEFEPRKFLDENSDFRGIITRSFKWDMTPQGHYYWEHIKYKPT